MLAKQLQGAALATIPQYIEDTFSTYLYTGTGAAQTITNGIDLSGKGGMTWIKSRSAATGNFLFDTERGALFEINSNTTDASVSLANSLTAFNSDGFSISSATGIGVNAATYTSWTFRKQAKFFDVVTYTGNGVAGRTVAHNLGSVPGCIIVKATNAASTNWSVYHRSLTTGSRPQPGGNYLFLNSTQAVDWNDNYWNNTNPTSTQFTVGSGTFVNANGTTYVAYLFAHDAGGFGASGTDNVISCGSFSTSGAGAATVTLGYEPQWVLWKPYSGTTGTGDWDLFDNMRGYAVPGATNDARLQPNNANAESNVNVGGPSATGFTVANLNASSNYIYIAIRRGPMKVPTDGTKVFKPSLQAGASNSVVTTGFPVDMTIATVPSKQNTGNNVLWDRLRGSTASAYTAPNLKTNTTDAEQNTLGVGYASNTGIVDGYFNNNFSVTNPIVYWNFRRAPGFFDVVCDTGTGSAHTISHNLGVVPELMIRKKRSAADNWIVYAGDATDYLILNTNAATADLNTMWNDTAPTASVFTVGTNDDVNQNTGTFVTYLFASVTGVSKVGSYTGNGSSQTINCGFTAGARFVLIKRTDSTGDWYVFDSARGIVAGNDPFLLLNSNAAEVTTRDAVDADNSGFIVNNDATNFPINVNNATYIYLAIA